MLIFHGFAEEVRRSRKRLGLTQEQAAEELSISVRWFQYIEEGHRIPSTSLALQMIALLEMDFPQRTT